MDLYEHPMAMMGLKQKKPQVFDAEAFFENADDIISEKDIEESIMQSEQVQLKVEPQKQPK